jgi:hypothetical protein
MFVNSCSAGDRVLDGPTNKVCQNTACPLGSEGQGKLLTPASYRLMQTANLAVPRVSTVSWRYATRQVKSGPVQLMSSKCSDLAFFVLSETEQ